MATSLGKTEQRTFTVVFTAGGVPAAVDTSNGPPTGKSSDPSIAELVLAADGMSGSVIGHAAGICDIEVVGDADLGAGIEAVLIREAITVTEVGQADGGVLVFGPATPQP